MKDAILSRNVFGNSSKEEVRRSGLSQQASWAGGVGLYKNF